MEMSVVSTCLPRLRCADTSACCEVRSIPWSCKADVRRPPITIHLTSSSAHVEYEIRASVLFCRLFDLRSGPTDSIRATTVEGCQYLLTCLYISPTDGLMHVLPIVILPVVSIEASPSVIRTYAFHD